MPPRVSAKSATKKPSTSWWLLQSEGRAEHPALSALSYLRGPKIEDAMVAIAKVGMPQERTSARQYLLDVGNPVGLDLVIETAQNAAGSERSYAIAALVDVGSVRAFDALREVAASASGSARMEAVAALVSAGVDADAKEILRDVLATGDSREMAAAAQTLVKLGDDDARAALLEALKSGHGPTAEAAAAVALELDRGDEMRQALLEAAAISPAVRTQVIDKLLEDGADEGLELARTALANKDEMRNAAYSLAPRRQSSGSSPARRLRSFGERGDPRSRRRSPLLH